MRRALTKFSLCCCLLVLSIQPASAASTDWVISISTQEVKKSVAYPASKLSPLIKATVKIEQGSDSPDEAEKTLAKAGSVDATEISPTLYEDIFYCRSAPVGLKRHNKLAVRPGTPGTIRIKTSDRGLPQEEAHAAANATARIFLDAHLKKSVLRSISVPIENYDLFVEGLKRYGFRPVQANAGSMVVAPIAISSEPAGRTTSLRYGM